ncbi:hypothetical protein [Actinomadura sp. 6N118]|uniref:hypothetical protein n=1 Tax=Actinomadura sp. 6N118 TaxID=3375151 RepID=UPI0037B52987
MPLAEPCISAITDSTEAGSPCPPSTAPPAAAPRTDDEVCACLLITAWTLHTGRQLRQAPVEELSQQELLDFWADPAWERL